MTNVCSNIVFLNLFEVNTDPQALCENLLCTIVQCILQQNFHQGRCLSSFFQAFGVTLNTKVATNCVSFDVKYYKVLNHGFHQAVCIL